MSDQYFSPTRYSRFCLFIFFLGFENFSLIWRRHHYRWWAANFLCLCSALMPFEHWGFVSVQRLLWHGASAYNGFLLRIRDNHTYCQAFRSGAVTTCFYELGLSRLGFEHPTFLLRVNALTHRATAAVSWFLIRLWLTFVQMEGHALYEWEIIVKKGRCKQL